ncbi:XRE family transcriptional regulator [Actinacidiphila acididurans]|uniref:XRE family transcriptional regulator n=1 Tax=Actinacidiphila acididurans TaxID=2784346 RepID=A0ABS2U0R1_9ACTN|nr:XRE family transcriptional regulator [Actinacidiphila acididurans]MBM9509184.1 XRE family transcriptional regulator [Actinacidiphila acididurans]
MDGNQNLITAMDEAGFTQAKLAEAVNAALWADGLEGTVSDRTVRNWMTGRTRWPHPRQRQALMAVFGCDAEKLGFVPPARLGPATEEEQPVKRREFFTTATGTAAAVVVPSAAARPNRVGTSDVIRLRDGMADLVSLDQAQGGHVELERLALARVSKALGLQQLSATQRVRQRLFGVAADYMSAAAWSAVDARGFDRAQSHLEQALYLAGMAQDSTALFEVWNLHAILARQRLDFAASVDAAMAARASTVARRDPMFASLAHARAAVGQAKLGERQSALRSLGSAHEILAKASADRPRPTWMAFYGPADLNALTAIVLNDLKDALEAEAASHKALALTPEQFRRNRAMALMSLALAQLQQGDIEQACATAGQVFTLMAGDPLPGRLRSRLGDFHRALITRAPDATAAREWADRHRQDWTTA